MNPKKWTLELFEDPEHPGELMLDISEACQLLGWQAGDRIEWTSNQDDTWTITRIESP